MTSPRRGADATSEAPPPTRKFFSQWRWWLPPSALALALTLVFLDPFAGDWDSLDYAVLAVRGWEPSPLLLGRMLFVFTNRALYLAAHALFGLRPEDAYLLFKYAVVVQSPLGVAALWALARDLTGSRRAATVAALMLALSPFYVVYGGQAMTEIPSILLLCVALTVHLRGLRHGSARLVLAGAALVGLGVNLREGVALFGVWLALAPFACGWRLKGRDLALTVLACVVFLVVALGPFALWFGADVGGYRAKWWGWVESTRAEAALHPATVENFGPLLRWFLIASPLALLALPFAVFSEWRGRGRTPLLLLALTGLFANLALVTHYSTVINGRYLLTGLPALLPLVADFLTRSRAARAPARLFARDRDETGDAKSARVPSREAVIKHVTKSEADRRDENVTGRRAFAPALVLVLVVGALTWWAVFDETWPTIQSHAAWKQYRARLEQLPRENAVVIAGGQTVAVTFWSGVGAGAWEVIGTGGGWPGNERVAGVIEEHLKQGRRVFLDADPRNWAATGWQAEETRAVAALASRFRFRRHFNTVYEIRPPDDHTARDTPDLAALLPENRRTP